MIVVGEQLNEVSWKPPVIVSAMVLVLDAVALMVTV